MIEIKDDEEKTFNQLINAEKPMVAFFWIEWATPATILRPKLEELVEKYGGTIGIFGVNCRNNPTIKATYKVLAKPMSLIFYKGKLMGSVAGPRISTIEAIIKGLLKNQNNLKQVDPL